jgi:hypothetical protein
MKEKLRDLSGASFTAPLNDKYINIINKEFPGVTLSKEFLWEHGIAEVLEVQP